MSRTGETHGGKGSGTGGNSDKFRENHDKIFSKRCPECRCKHGHKMDCSRGREDISRLLRLGE